MVSALSCFTIGPHLARGALWLEERRCAPFEGRGRKRLLTGRPPLRDPVLLQMGGGGRPADWVFAGGDLHVVSLGLRDHLLAFGASGWKTFEVEIVDIGGNLIPGYTGLHILGQCGEPVRNQGPWVRGGPLVQAGPRFWRQMGFIVDESTWDGSDLFVPGETGHVLVSRRLGESLRKARMKCRVIASEDFERSDPEPEAPWLADGFVPGSDPRLPPSSVPGVQPESPHVLHHVIDHGACRPEPVLEGKDRWCPEDKARRLITGDPPVGGSVLFKCHWDELPIHQDSFGWGLYSERVRNALQRSKATGWKEFDAVVTGPARKRLKGIRGIHFMGRIDPLDWKAADRVRRTVDEGTRRAWYRRGPGVSPSSPRGADLFVPSGSGWTLVSSRIAATLNRLHLTNLEVMPLADLEMEEAILLRDRTPL